MEKKIWWYRARAFLLTYLAYTCFHMTRKVPSVTKGVLHPISSTGKSSYDPETNPGWAPFNDDLVPYKVAKEGFKVSGAEDFLNGAYSCVDEKLSKDHPCELYRKNGKESAQLTLLWANSSITTTDTEEESICPGFKKCWVLLNELGSGNIHIYYRQMYDGYLPASPTASEAPDVIHWEKRITDGLETRWKRDKNVKTKPKTLDGSILLGSVDSVFLGFYTVGLFTSGYIGDQINLRLFLTVGMIGSACSMILMSMAYVWHIHSFAYFLICSAIFGAFQSVGWPSVVAIMGSWFGHGNRGFIMGVWNSHTSIGNILGSVITAAAVGMGMHHEDWPLGYLVPASIMGLAALVIYMFLVPHPEDVGLVTTEITHLDDDEDEQDNSENDVPLLANAERGEEGEYVDEQEEEFDARDQEFQDHEKLVRCGESFRQALQIKGLIPFSLSLMFSKMCAYSLLYWGPYYLGSVGFTSEKAGYLCSFFDVGGIFGGITAGYLSDKLQSRALVAFIFQVVGIPVMAFYYHETTRLQAEVTPNIWLMILVGFFINAPYALITTAVSADLGTQLEGNDALLALVTGIIDGTGSFGAMIQGIVVGSIQSDSWKSVWNFLMVAQGLSAIMILQLVHNEIKVLWYKFRR